VKPRRRLGQFALRRARAPWARGLGSCQRRLVASAATCGQRRNGTLMGLRAVLGGGGWPGSAC